MHNESHEEPIYGDHRVEVSDGPDDSIILLDCAKAAENAQKQYARSSQRRDIDIKMTARSCKFTKFWAICGYPICFRVYSWQSKEEPLYLDIT